MQPISRHFGMPAVTSCHCLLKNWAKHARTKSFLSYLSFLTACYRKPSTLGDCALCAGQGADDSLCCIKGVTCLIGSGPILPDTTRRSMSRPRFLVTDSHAFIVSHSRATHSKVVV